MKYLYQTVMNGYFCCRLVALLNALRFHGRLTCPSTGPYWQYWVDRCNCRNEDNPVPEKVRADLGVTLREVSLNFEEVSRNLPVMIPIRTDQPYPHWALVVRAADGIVDVANYKGHLSTQPVYSREWGRLRLCEDETAYAVEHSGGDVTLDNSLPG